MWISNIKIKNFRNYTDEKIELNKNINVFYGENAQGKTNIIEAIYLTAMGKSYRTKKESEMINFNSQNSLIEVEYFKSDRDGKVKIELGNKKNIYLNGIRLKKLSELLGNIHLVIFTPDDIGILKGSPQNRRRFLDIMISQLRPNYVNIYNLYLKTLEQRNNYLRQIKEQNKEKEEFLKLLKERRKLDIIKGFTTKGIHRDDFLIYINGKETSVYGSQGQNRTAMLSLKLSELNVVYDEIGEYPILLLDDFMSELDSKRRKSFLENVRDTQVIITCTEKISIENLKTFMYNVKKGKVYQE